jgi:hypothetical protein
VRRLLFILTTAIGFMLVAASLAFACTDVINGGVVMDDPSHNQDLFTLTNSPHPNDQCGDATDPSRPAACRGTETWAQLTWPFQPVGPARQTDFYQGVNPGQNVTLHGVKAIKDYRTANSRSGTVEYGLFFLNHTSERDEHLACMSQNHNVDLSPDIAWEQRLNSGTSYTADSRRDIWNANGNPIQATVPSTAQGTNADTGPAAICFMSVDNDTGRTNGEVGTNPAYLTIL